MTSTQLRSVELDGTGTIKELRFPDPYGTEASVVTESGSIEAKILFRRSDVLTEQGRNVLQCAYWKEAPECFPTVWCISLGKHLIGCAQSCKRHLLLIENEGDGEETSSRKIVLELLEPIPS